MGAYLSVSQHTGGMIAAATRQLRAPSGVKGFEMLRAQTIFYLYGQKKKWEHYVEGLEDLPSPPRAALLLSEVKLTSCAPKPA